MGKLLLLFLVVAALYLIFVRSGRPSVRSDKAPKPDGTMVRCAHCGVHFPRDDGVVADGHSFCCEEHGRLGQR